MTDSREFSLMMSYEEAGELILEGEPWVLCWECNGTGREAPSSNFQCSGCAGFKVILKRGYRDACRLLSKELPQPPVSGLDRFVGGSDRESVKTYDF